MRRSSVLLGALALSALMAVAHATGGTCPHATSYIESSQFHCQSDAGWAARKEVAVQQYLLNKEHRGWHSGQGWFQANWEPEWHCELMERIGRMGDGGKVGAARPRDSPPAACLCAPLPEAPKSSYLPCTPLCVACLCLLTHQLTSFTRGWRSSNYMQ